ncbi:MAG: hypothetical protein ABSF77_02470 [Spirochaetia bacterium]|jgi:NAD(P)-dependent dehydrogenase (short-subunit alcohol dehydrogenase family)
MPRTMLITEGSSPLGGALIRLFVARGCTVAATREAAREGAPHEQTPNTGAAPGASGRSILNVPWNRRSPASARTVLLTVLNSLENIDEAVILEPPSPTAAPLHEASSSDIERAFDDAKGPAFIAREVLSWFLRSGAGVLCMVSGGPPAGPLESGARECFRGFASSLLAGPGGAGIVANGFQNGGGVDVEEYAAFIDRTLEEKARKISGRWFTCQPRTGFFQGVLAGQPRRG